MDKLPEWSKELTSSIRCQRSAIPAKLNKVGFDEEEIVSLHRPQLMDKNGSFVCLGTKLNPQQEKLPLL